MKTAIHLLLFVSCCLPLSLIADSECPELYAKFGIKATGKRLKVTLSQASYHALSTDAGQKALASFGFKNTDELIKYIEQVDRPLNKIFRQHTLNVLHEIDDLVAALRGQMVKNGSMEAGRYANTVLNEQEKILIEILAQRLLRPEPKAVLAFRTPEKFVLKKAEFFKKPTTPLFDEKGFTDSALITKATGSTKQSLLKQGEQFHKAMKECVANMPKTEAAFSSRAVGAALQQVLVSEVITASSYFMVNGKADIKINDLGVNMIVTALANGFGTFMLNGNGTVAVRFVQAVSFHAGLDVVGSGLYMISEVPETQFAVSPTNYWIFNATAGAISTAAGVPLNDFLIGFSCLYPKAVWKTFNNSVSYGARTAFSVGVNLLYFQALNSVLYPGKPAEEKAP